MNYHEVFHLQEWNGWYFVQNYQWPRAIFFFLRQGKLFFAKTLNQELRIRVLTSFKSYK